MKSGKNRKANLTPELLRPLVAELLVDSLSALGHGVPSNRSDMSTLASELDALDGIVFNEIRPHLGHGMALKFQRRLHELPSIADPALLGHTEFAAIRARVHAVQRIAARMGESGDTDQTTPAIRLASLASNAFGVESGETREGRKVIPRSADGFSQAASSLLLNGRPPGWRVGATRTDLTSAVIRLLLTPMHIAADWDDWKNLIVDCDDFGCAGQPWPDSVIRAQHRMLRFIREATKRKRESIEQALAIVGGLQYSESEIVSASTIEPYCFSLGAPPHHQFQLGTRGYVEISALFGYLPGSKPPEPVTPEVLQQLESGWGDPAFWGSDESRAKQAHAHEIEARIGILPVPIGGARSLTIWRGCPDSASHAVTEVERVLSASIRTAWLAMFGSESVLSYIVNSRYRAPDPHHFRSAQVEMEGEQAHIRDIRRYPADFPVHAWIEYVFEHLVSDSMARSQSSDFAARAVRILRESDDLLFSSPRQSFVCSMSAIELCLVGKGEPISETLARRAARLTTESASRRLQSQRLFRRLYDVRSRIVHGDGVEVTVATAALMRYVASTVVFGFAGLGRALPRFGVLGGETELRNYLDSDFEAPGLPPGVHGSNYFQQLTGAPSLTIDRLLED